GDKLLGGPQCGLIVGKRAYIEQLEANPLMRTYRVDKLTLLALEATLRHYLDPQDALVSIPALSMLAASTDELANRARSLLEQLEKAVPDEHFYVCSDVGFAGGGSMPGKELPTVVVQWRPARHSVDATIAALREAEVPVVARVRDDAICFDLRTLRPADFEALVASVGATVWDEDPGPDRDGLPLPVL
ncbi:MAG: L-seryl-tRNA(Sec) selenium transferase, partial [Planctomycetota bacterium]